MDEGAPHSKTSDAQPIGAVLDTDGGVEDKVEQALKIKKRAKQQFMGASVAVDSNYVKKKIDKSDAQALFIREALLEHFLFGALDKNELTDVVNAMEFENVAKGAWNVLTLFVRNFNLNFCILVPCRYCYYQGG